MELTEKHCWAEIDINALKHNYNLIKDTFDKPFYAVIKADAYGHGAKYVAKIYSELGCFGFCVSSFGEAMELRKSGITKPILILGYTEPTKAHELFKNNLTQTVFSLEYATKLNDNALYPIDCHIKIDTGMGRLGFDMVNNKEQAVADMKSLRNLPNLRFTGLFTHFAVADSVDEESLIYTQRRLDLYAEAKTVLENRGFNIKYFHGQNSAGIARKLDAGFNIMRAGIVLYGRQPSDQVILPEIKPAMKLKTVVTHVKTIKDGAKVGYGIKYTAQGERKIATAAAGYADGIPRLLTAVGHNVEINGKLYPIIGNICMDQIMIDITGADIKAGDEITIFGGDGEISYTETAKKIMTIPHELMCAVAKRVPKVYTDNGKITYIQYGI